MKVTSVKSGCIASPPGPRKRSREAMSVGSCERPGFASGGTGLGFLFLVCASSIELDKIIKLSTSGVILLRVIEMYMFAPSVKYLVVRLLPAIIRPCRQSIVHDRQLVNSLSHCLGHHPGFIRTVISSAKRILNLPVVKPRQPAANPPRIFDGNILD